MKTFPTQYPFSNRQGVTFDKEFLERIAGGVFKAFGELARSKGLELSYVMMWAMEECNDINTFPALVGSSFIRAAKWPSRMDIKFALLAELDDDIVDPIMNNFDKEVLTLIDFERLIEEDGEEIKKALESDRRTKYKILQKLKEKWTGE